VFFLLSFLHPLIPFPKPQKPAYWAPLLMEDLCPALRTYPAWRRAFPQSPMVFFFIVLCDRAAGRSGLFSKSRSLTALSNGCRGKAFLSPLLSRACSEIGHRANWMIRFPPVTMSMSISFFQSGVVLTLWSTAPLSLPGVGFFPHSKILLPRRPRLVTMNSPDVSFFSLLQVKNLRSEYIVFSRRTIGSSVPAGATYCCPPMSAMEDLQCRDDCPLSLSGSTGLKDQYKTPDPPNIVRLKFSLGGHSITNRLRFFDPL